MNGEAVTLNENIPFSCFENNSNLISTFRLPGGLEGNRFIFKFTADRVDLRKIVFYGSLKSATQQDESDTLDGQNEKDE